MTYTENTNYLIHHGIKGQKWGVRKYQNEDGTLTAAGKQRYEVNGDTYQRGNYGNDNQRQAAYNNAKMASTAKRGSRLELGAKAASNIYGHHVLTLNSDKKGLDTYARSRAAGQGVGKSAFKSIAGTAIRDVGRTALWAAGGAAVGALLGKSPIKMAQGAAVAAYGATAVRSALRIGRSIRNTAQGIHAYNEEARDEKRSKK